MSAKRRIYLVEGAATGPRLVRASSATQARNHVAGDLFRVSVAGQDELVAMLSRPNGCNVEDAGSADDGADE